jgi:hypothetical protein
LPIPAKYAGFRRKVPIMYKLTFVLKDNCVVKELYASKELLTNRIKEIVSKRGEYSVERLSPNGEWMPTLILV